jgi:uncharacterized protein (TIGR02246 family)
MGKHAHPAEPEIRDLLDEWANAIRAKDADAVMAHYALDVLAFDLLPPLQYRGAEAVRSRLSEWLTSFQGPIGFEMRDLRITTGDGVGFCHGLNGVSGTTKGGAKVDMWWRATNCFQRVEGKWLVTHGHNSEPFDMQSGKALVDLKP